MLAARVHEHLDVKLRSLGFLLPWDLATSNGGVQLPMDEAVVVRIAHATQDLPWSFASEVSCQSTRKFHLSLMILWSEVLHVFVMNDSKKRHLLFWFVLAVASIVVDAEDMLAIWHVLGLWVLCWSILLS